MTRLNPTSKIDSLQAIRAFAAIAVMFAHGGQMLYERLNYVFLNNIFMAGFSGVDVFFVLSGFIILHTSSSGKYNALSFLKKRFIRIYPIYWIVTALLITAYFVSPAPGQEFKGDPTVIIGSVLLLPQPQYVVGVAWTLAYEVMFYMLFAATYFKNKKYLVYALLLWSIAILLTYSLKFKFGHFSIDALTRPIIIDFSLGCLAAYFFRRFKIFRYSAWFFWGGITLFLTAHYVYYQQQINGSNDTYEMTRVYYFGFPAALLIFGALYLTITNRLLVFLGDASYSIYLLHGTVLSFLLKIVLKYHLESNFSTLAGSITLFSLTLMVCCIFYLTVEKNLLCYLGRKIT